MQLFATELLNLLSSAKNIKIVNCQITQKNETELGARYHSKAHKPLLHGLHISTFGLATNCSCVEREQKKTIWKRT